MYMFIPLICWEVLRMRWKTHLLCLINSFSQSARSLVAVLRVSYKSELFVSCLSNCQEESQWIVYEGFRYLNLFLCLVETNLFCDRVCLHFMSNITIPSFKSQCLIGSSSTSHHLTQTLEVLSWMSNMSSSFVFGPWSKTFLNIEHFSSTSNANDAKSFYFQIHIMVIQRAGTRHFKFNRAKIRLPLSLPDPL